MFKVLTLVECAHALDIHKETCAELITQGKLPGVKVGRQFRILEQDLYEFLHGPTEGGKGVGDGPQKTPRRR